jgi:hypothetical protein
LRAVAVAGAACSATSPPQPRWPSIATASMIADSATTPTMSTATTVIPELLVAIG